MKDPVKSSFDQQMACTVQLIDSVSIRNIVNISLLKGHMQS